MVTFGFVEVINGCGADARVPAKVTGQGPPVGPPTETFPAPMLDKASSADCTCVEVAFQAIVEAVCPFHVNGNDPDDSDVDTVCVSFTALAWIVRRYPSVS